MPPRLALKIDVDTLAGFRQGVPALLAILAHEGVAASFFLALGPDNSGRAIFRVLRQKDFLAKMFRTRAPAIYGLRTMCYGTLLPAPLIAAATPAVLPAFTAAGHELGLHGYDHVRWHDDLFRLAPAAVAQEIRAAQTAFTNLTGRRAVSFAAPGWQCSAASRADLAAAGFLYASNTRGTGPYFPEFDGMKTPVLEIPTTLPTLDELLGFHGCGPDDFFRLVLARLTEAAPQVLTIHAEIEGGPYRQHFARFLHEAREQGVVFFRLQDWAGELLADPAAIHSTPVIQARLPGRAGTVSCQGPPKGTA